MYDELVKALRGCVMSKPCDGCPYYAPGGPTEKCATLNIAAADAIEELSVAVRVQKAVLEKFPHWIPVTERLPDMNVPCLVYNRSQPKMVGWRIDYKRFRIPGSCLPDPPTHWMPLPERPEEGET